MPSSHNQSAKAHRKFELRGPALPGFQVETPLLGAFLVRNVSVSADDNRNLWFLALIQLREIVQDVNGNAAQFEHFGRGKLASPRTLVHIARTTVTGAIAESASKYSGDPRSPA